MLLLCSESLMLNVVLLIAMLSVVFAACLITLSIVVVMLSFSNTKNDAFVQLC